MHDTLEGWLCVWGGGPSYRVFISLKKNDLAISAFLLPGP